MKKCGNCGEFKPLSEFYVRKTGKLTWACKKCSNELATKWQKNNSEKDKQLSIENENNIIGGYKIYILNHVKKGEFKYNVISTIGTTFKSNDVNEFHKKIKEVLCLK